MPALLRYTLLSIRDLLLAAGPFVLIVLALLWLAYVLLEPTPPKRVVLATGPEQSAYAAFGRVYAQELARHGIEVQLRTTEGSAENLRLLRDAREQVDLAFVQGGAGEALFAVDEDRSGVPLVSIGSLFYEPVWIFYRGKLRGGAAGPLHQLDGRRPVLLHGAGKARGDVLTPGGLRVRVGLARGVVHMVPGRMQAAGAHAQLAQEGRQVVGRHAAELPRELHALVAHLAQRLQHPGRVPLEVLADRVELDPDGDPLLLGSLPRGLGIRLRDLGERLRRVAPNRDSRGQKCCCAGAQSQQVSS